MVCYLLHGRQLIFQIKMMHGGMLITRSIIILKVYLRVFTIGCPYKPGYLEFSMLNHQSNQEKLNLAFENYFG